MLTQVTAKNCVHFDTLAVHKPMNHKKHAAMLSALTQEFENRNKVTYPTSLMFLLLLFKKKIKF